MNSVQRLGVAEGVGGRKGLLSFSWIYVYLAFCEKKMRVYSNAHLTITLFDAGSLRAGG